MVHVNSLGLSRETVNSLNIASYCSCGHPLVLLSWAIPGKPPVGSMRTLQRWHKEWLLPSWIKQWFLSAQATLNEKGHLPSSEYSLLMKKSKGEEQDGAVLHLHRLADSQRHQKSPKSTETQRWCKSEIIRWPISKWKCILPHSSARKRKGKPLWGVRSHQNS